MVAGGSLGEAAGYLGIASTDTTWLGKSGIYTGVGHVRTGARQQPRPSSFGTALARELDDPATPLVNYQRRRQALLDRCIDEGTWTDGLWRCLPCSAQNLVTANSARARVSAGCSRPARVTCTESTRPCTKTFTTT